MKIFLARTFAVAFVLILTATGLWAAGAEETPGAAADKKYVTDPSTGKVVVAPQYGGTITYAQKREPAGPDTVISGPWAQEYVGPVLEKLGIPDWATPRDEFDFKFHSPPKHTIGQLAESWSQPDPLTYIVKVRQGVHWHDKAPMNGREVTAQDIEYNYHRILGLGSGFAERSQYARTSWTGVQVESITATDEWTVVFALKEPSLRAPVAILDGNIALDIPPRGNQGTRGRYGLEEPGRHRTDDAD